MTKFEKEVLQELKGIKAALEAIQSYYPNSWTWTYPITQMPELYIYGTVQTSDGKKTTQYNP